MVSKALKSTHCLQKKVPIKLKKSAVMVRTAMYSVADFYEHYNKSIRSNIKGGGGEENA